MLSGLAGARSGVFIMSGLADYADCLALCPMGVQVRRERGHCGWHNVVWSWRCLICLYRLSGVMEGEEGGKKKERGMLEGVC